MLNKNTHKPIVDIVEKLFSDSGTINFFNHAIVNKYGEVLDIGLGNSWNSWVKNFNKKYLQHPSITTDRMITGIHFWKRNKDIYLSEAQEEARKYFDLDGKIDFITEGGNQTFYFYSFGCSRKDADKAYHFYDMHRAKLLKFIAHFNKEASELIAEINVPENRVQIPNYTANKVSENLGAKISDREFEILILFGNGYTTKQIAKVLNKNFKTIETHLANVHQKTGCANRIAMRQYIKQNGWEGLEQFFLNYHS